MSNEVVKKEWEIRVRRVGRLVAPFVRRRRRGGEGRAEQREGQGRR
jgi:hypothetical protein